MKLLSVIGLLIWATLCIRLLPFKYSASLMGRAGMVAPRGLNEDQMQEASDLAWAMHCIVRHIPWDATCLIQALACQVWLIQHRLPATVFLGVSKDSDQPVANFQAHAWVLCGQNVIVGGQNVSCFKVIASFGGYGA
ncbi:lasso peptide biosynthesis B2 protein [Polynucleobacter sp. es-EL-1]|uniref:lasso peptide biosynthesis B2 protein n=1 Tax=Polynucleobacter sp. es-EL-1 TaxID=1855652 RepID=UPI001BFE35EE|nr:lasso peptide biosynthesis B2 protein [Polynucleobacter sp. es-EL-1]QWE11338.1 lasso peptide biosynthesis B2 protein [Polynucleobacter sp. es-EL-1]